MSSATPVRAFQWDLARQVERLDVLLKLLPRYAEWGYQELYLHLEDAIEYPDFPSVARDDAYNVRQFQTLVSAATRVGIGVVPIVNLLGHTQYLIKTDELRDLNELRDEAGAPLPNGQLCPLHPRTQEVADKLLRYIAPFCTTGKVHVGLDESFHLGKCPRCRAEVARRGLAHHFAAHVNRLRKSTGALGLRMGMWADMLAFLPEAIPLLPSGLIAYDWYYYPFRRHPRVEMYNFTEYDLATPLQARGIEYWGCPMNGAFRFEPMPLFRDRLANLRSWWERCRHVGAGGFLVTSWEAYRLAFELTTVVDAAAASLWLEEGAPSSDLEWLTRGFERVFGRAGAKASARAALASEAYPFAGYARWDINRRWDVISAHDSPESFVQERKVFARLASQRIAAPLSSSLAWRLYLAERDVFVRRCIAGVRRLRRGRRVNRLVEQLGSEAQAFQGVLANGRRAAKAMWARTRDPQRQGQNLGIIALDTRRLATWRAWLRRCARDHRHVATASPVMGAWQLNFVVRTTAPAVQKVVVEEKTPGGIWHEVHGRHAIEFQAVAAHRRTNTRRHFAAPVSSPATELRICVHGIGFVLLEGIELTDGVSVLRPRGSTRPRRLGKTAPKHGMPDPSATGGARSRLVLSFARR